MKTPMMIYEEQGGNGTQTVKPPQGEQALAAVDTELSAWLAGTPDYNPDDIEISTYRDMAKRDDQVKACLKLKKLAIPAPGWRLDPFDDTPEAERQVEFTEDVFTRMPGSIMRMFMDSLSAIAYGFSIQEPVYEPIIAGDWAGKWGLKAIKLRPAETFGFVSDKHGNLTKLKQTTSFGNDIPLKPEDFIIWTYGEESNRHYGDSDLRAVYRNWYAKDILIRFWNVFLEKFGAPTMVGEYEPGTGKPEQDKILAVLEQIAFSKAVVLPKGWKHELLEATRTGKASYLDAVKYHDRAIARGLLIPSLLIEEGDRGSRALGDDHLDIFHLTTSATGDELAETVYTEQLIRRLVAFNFADPKPPQFVWNDRQAKDRKGTVDEITRMIVAGVLDPTEAWIRQVMDYPEWEEPEFIRSAEAYGLDSGVSGEVVKYDIGGMRFDLDTGEQNTFDGVTKVLESELKRIEKMVPDLLKSKNQQRVAKLEIKKVNQLRDVFSREMNQSWANGLTHAHKETERGIGEQLKFTMMAETKTEVYAKKDVPPVAKDALAAIKARVPMTWDEVKDISWDIHRRAFLIADVLAVDVVKQAKLVLMEGISDGLSVEETTLKLRESFAPFVGLEVAEDVISPYRLETITRNAMAKSFNDGRWAFTESPELDQFLAGYEYVAVLDGRVTDLCESLDGKFFKRGDPDLENYRPQNHHNCRSQLITMTRHEPFDVTPKDQLPPKADIPKGFRGPEGART